MIDTKNSKFDDLKLLSDTRDYPMLLEKLNKNNHTNFETLSKCIGMPYISIGFDKLKEKTGISDENGRLGFKLNDNLCKHLFEMTVLKENNTYKYNWDNRNKGLSREDYLALNDKERYQLERLHAIKADLFESIVIYFDEHRNEDDSLQSDNEQSNIQSEKEKYKNFIANIDQDDKEILKFHETICTYYSENYQSTDGELTNSVKEAFKKELGIDKNSLEIKVKCTEASEKIANLSKKLNGTSQTLQKLISPLNNILMDQDFYNAQITSEKRLERLNEFNKKLDVLNKIVDENTDSTNNKLIISILAYFPKNAFNLSSEECNEISKISACNQTLQKSLRDQTCNKFSNNLNAQNFKDQINNMDSLSLSLLNKKISEKGKVYASISVNEFINILEEIPSKITNKDLAKIQKKQNIKKIYDALYEGETTIWKKRGTIIDDLINDKLSLNDFYKHVENNPNSRTAKAFNLYTHHNKNGISKNNFYLLKDIHEYCKNHSGLFYQTDNNLNNTTNKNKESSNSLTLFKDYAEKNPYSRSAKIYNTI
ncbi:MAG: hypothetical protein EP298_00085 [Gammaproteobacteria bacterium]|nr:MAG: hypothetical protein EP298_00085 [Gammaproteobacteria bacterium]UTW41591.1 hypothetical protein KFE69_08730 [bacterium SCSIO 12844]